MFPFIIIYKQKGSSFDCKHSVRVLGPEVPQQIQTPVESQGSYFILQIQIFKKCSSDTVRMHNRKNIKDHMKVKISSRISHSHQSLCHMKHKSTTQSPSTRHPNSLLLFHLSQVRCLGLRGREKQRSTMGRIWKRKGLERYLSSLRKWKLTEIHRKTII